MAFFTYIFLMIHDAEHPFYIFIDHEMSANFCPSDFFSLIFLFSMEL